MIPVEHAGCDADTTTKAEVKMAEYYARRAGEYDRIYAIPERQDDLSALRERVGHLLAGRHVLELACGTGYWTEVVSRSAASVTAIDINEEVLTIARARPLGAQTVRFVRADVYALPTFSRPFEGALAAFWWSHVPRTRLRAFLDGFHRGLAAGARVVLIDNVYVEGSSTPICRTDSDANTYQKRTLDDGSVHEILKNFPTQEELRETLAGLACGLHVEILKYYWIVTYALPG